MTKHFSMLVQAYSFTSAPDRARQAVGKDGPKLGLSDDNGKTIWHTL
jgi:hypothetical protein